MGLLTRAQILAAKDLHITVVPVPEWGDGAEVGVRVITGAELHTFSNLLANLAPHEPFNQRAYICALTICDEHGGRLFSVEEIDALAEKSSVVIDRIYEEACRVNLLRDSDREAAKKNGSLAPIIASGSSSPDSSADAASENGNAPSTPMSSTNGC